MGLILTACLLSVAGCVSPGSRETPAADARLAGAEQAERDLAQGRLGYLVYGLAAPQDVAFARLMEQRLGVQVMQVGACAIPGEEVSRAKGYNRVMLDEIERRYGAATLERLKAESARGATTQQARLVAGSGSGGH